MQTHPEPLLPCSSNKIKKHADFTDFENYVPFNVANYERFVRQNPDVTLKDWVLTGL